VTRIFAARLQQRLGQPFVIENRGGAGGNLGAEAVYVAEPDGYTLLASQPAPLTVNMVLYKKINFDPAALVPVGIMTRIPNTLTVRTGFPAKTVQEFIAYAKANPGKLNYASQGNGTTSHLTAEMFSQATGIKMTHVPYRGTAPAVNDLIAGHVDLMFNELASSMEMHKAGRAQILAVTTAKRIEELPNLPTVIESGVPNFISDTWNAITAPPKTPPAVIAKLNAALNAALKMPELRATILRLHAEPAGGDTKELADLIKADTIRWGDVVRAANVKIE
jgi:tripartite-type tricarboxylate transporter receptor subunit TctC